MAKQPSEPNSQPVAGTPAERLARVNRALTVWVLAEPGSDNFKKAGDEFARAFLGAGRLSHLVNRRQPEEPVEPALLYKLWWLMRGPDETRPMRLSFTALHRLALDYVTREFGKEGMTVGLPDRYEKPSDDHEDERVVDYEKLLTDFRANEGRWTKLETVEKGWFDWWLATRCSGTDTDAKKFFAFSPVAAALVRANVFTKLRQYWLATEQ